MSSTLSNMVEAELKEYLRPVPWQWFTTFTVTRKMRNGDEERRWLWSQFLERIKERHRDTLGYIASEERRTAGSDFAGINLHFHACFTSNRLIDANLLRTTWSDLAGHDKRASKIEPYDPTRGGLKYVLKGFNKPWAWHDFSKDLKWFIPSCRNEPRNAYELRLQRRHERRVLAAVS